ncbi:MAG: alginate export family protein [Geobacteraceae bacterium]|nr:alginate export family protein [Geobacteraceae bacterium]
MKKICFYLAAIFVSLLISCPAFSADDEAGLIPERVTGKHWSCRDLEDLGNRYGAPSGLSSSQAIGTGSYSRGDLAAKFYPVLQKIIEKCETGGRAAVPTADWEKITRLHEQLKENLTGLEGYQTRRDTIERLLSPPVEPSFELKYGLKGFLRGEGAENYRLPDLSFNPGHAEGRLLYRVLPYVYWHPVDFLDIHLEGQGYGYTGGSQYLGKYSLYQGFIEGRLPGTDIVSLKVGRQELVYGSAFILGSNSWFQGLTFDAARVRVKPLDALTLDFLGGWYATPWSDGMKGNIVGGYVSYDFGGGTVLEAYGFNDTGSAEHHGGEYLNIWGLRATAALGPVVLEIEPVFESGRTMSGLTGFNDRISAWGGHADATLETELFGRTNSFFAGYAYGSGDKDGAYGISSRREFRNSATDTSLTGDMSFIGDLSGVDAGDHHASGLQIFNLGWGIDLAENLNFSSAFRYFYANAVEDGMSRRIGLETDLSLTYAVNDSLTVLLGYDRFFTGKFFRDATGRGNDIDYGYVLLEFDLFHEVPRTPAVK